MITIEQYAAITSSVFAGISVYLIIKTKSLTDVVKEMQNQTRILSDRLSLELSLSNSHKFPMFIIKRFATGRGFTSELDLYNIGQYATHFFVTDVKGDVSIKSENIIYNQAEGEYLNKDVRIYLSNKVGDWVKEFSFTFHYKNGYGKPMSQGIYYKDPDIEITPNNLLA